MEGPILSSTAKQNFPDPMGQTFSKVLTSSWVALLGLSEFIFSVSQVSMVGVGRE